MQAIEALLQRRSGRVLHEPAPDDAALELMFNCALRAPDHGRLQPWRFIVVRGEARMQLGELLAGHLRRTRPDASQEALERERRKAFRAPLVIIVAAVIQPAGKIPPIEQILSAGTAAHSMLLAALALGFNAVWKTGSAAYDDQVKVAVGLEPKDSLVGFLYVGSEQESPPPAPKLNWRDFVSHWNTAAPAAIGAFGLDLSAGKADVRPGDDFFNFAGGRWIDTFEIPADRASFGPFNVLDELSRQRVRGLIERAAACEAAHGTPEQKIGDFYASFMDRATLEARDLGAAQPDLERIAAAISKDQVAALFGGGRFASLFDVSLPPDLKEPDRYSVVLGQSRLGLPDRDYYLSDDPQLRALRERYGAYIDQMLTLAGVREAAGQAGAILALEIAIAQRHWPIERRRDVEATYNPRTKAELVAYAPGFPWQSFLDAADLGDREQLILSELSAIRDLAQLFDATALATLRAYLTFHYLSDHASFLPARFDTARFDFYGRTLRGQPQQRDLWKRAVDEVNGALGELVGQLYVAAYFPPDSKAKLQDLVSHLCTALGARIAELAWMTPQTKARAREKLAGFKAKIGYPERWKDYSELEVRRDDLLGNVHRATQWEWHYQVARLDGPVDRDEWHMTPQEINAYYNPLNNEIVFPAAILQPPFFDPNADDAVNYGAIGAVIGHEIGHGFDDQGRKFGADGSLKEWWTEKDAEVFTGLATRLIRQYSAFEALPGLHVNGANTVGENIGDLGGLNMAYHAYQLSLEGREPPVLQGLSGQQRFFLSWAQIWREKYREGRLRELLISDVHSPAAWRVNGPLPNIDAWYDAFGVQPGDKLYLKPEDRVAIW